MAVFSIKKGDRLPKLRMALTDSSGAALDLTNASVVFRMKSQAGGALKVNAAADVVAPATGGIVEYAWGATDTDTAGAFDAEWVLAYAGGNRTVPTSGFVTVLVGAVLS